MGWLRRLLGETADSSGSWCDRIDPAAVHGYQGALRLIPCAVRLRGPRALAFAERLDDVLAGLPVSRVTHLDRSIRDRSRWDGGWFGASELRALLPRHLPAHRELFLCLALCHPSGYARAPAIAEVSARLLHGTLARRSVLALQLLVLRRNDWVGTVADAAARALDRLLTDGLAAYWVQALPLVDRLPELARRDHAGFVMAVHAAARGAAWAGPLMAGIRSGDRQIARSAVRFALRSPAVSQPDVVDATLDAFDPVVRLLGARAAESVTASDGREALLRRLERDPFMPVRREALALRTAWFPETLGAAHEQLLFDPSRALRAQAQAAITKRGVDPAESYRARLGDADPASSTIALLGLAEVGQAADAPLAARFVEAPRAKSRAAALRCLARLAGDRYLDTLVAALRDPSPRVLRAAGAGLLGRVHCVGVDRLMATLDDAPSKHSKRVVLRLLFESDMWAPLGPLVRCAAEGDADERAWAVALLSVWFTRHRGWSSSPPAPRVDALRAALAEGGTKLDASVHRELEFLLSTLSKT